VWGNEETFLYSMHPDTFGKKEVVSMWGFPYVLRNWNYEGLEGHPTELVVFSKADEAEVFVNGKSIGRKPVSKERPFPYSVRFETTFQPGEVIAVSYQNGKEVSRATLVTTGSAQRIRLVPEKSVMAADGHDLSYVNIEITDRDGRVVPDAAVALRADVSGAGRLAGFGSANPITEEDYTDSETVSYHGRALLIMRAGYESGTCSVEICANGFEPVKAEFRIQ
jgi:beta-galactosidase